MKLFAFYDVVTKDVDCVCGGNDTTYSKEGFGCVEISQETYNEIRSASYGAYFDGSKITLKPTPQYKYFKWNTSAFRWEYDQENELVSETEAVRDRRDFLLSKLDELVSNPLRWAALSEAEKSQMGAYRQALLDVPQQSGFPLNTNWPVAPSVLN